LCINETSIIADVIAALRLIIFVGRKWFGGNIASENAEPTLWPFLAKQMLPCRKIY